LGKQELDNDVVGSAQRALILEKYRGAANIREPSLIVLENDHTLKTLRITRSIQRATRVMGAWPIMRVGGQCGDNRRRRRAAFLGAGHCSINFPLSMRPQVPRMATSIVNKTHARDNHS